MVRNDAVIEEPVALLAPTRVYPDALGQLGHLEVADSNERVPLLRQEQVGWRHKKQACGFISIASCAVSAVCLFASIPTPVAATWSLISVGLSVGYGIGSVTSLVAGYYSRKETEVEEKIKFDANLDKKEWEEKEVTQPSDDFLY